MIRLLSLTCLAAMLQVTAAAAAEAVAAELRARAPPASQCGAARKRRVRPTALRSAGAGRSAPTRDRGKLQPPTAPPKEPPRSLLQRKALAADAETRHTRWDQEQRGRRLRMIDAPPRTTRSSSRAAR